MASLRLSSNRWYVVTDDSEILPVPWKTPFLKFTFLTFSLITLAVVGLYFAGIIGEETVVEEVVDENFPIVELDANNDVACESYSMLIDNCTDISTDEIIENGCMAYVERSGSICARSDNRTLCVVNEDCNNADLSVISQPSLSIPDGAKDALCNSYSKVVDACIDVSVEEISENGCMSYVESTGRICVSFDKSQTMCVVNEDCDQLDTIPIFSV